VRVASLASMLTAVLLCGGTAGAADQLVLFAPGSITNEPVWGLTFLAGTVADEKTKLVDILGSPWSADFGDGYFAGVAISRKIARVYQHFTIEGEFGLSARFGDTDTDAGEGWAAIYTRFDGFSNQVFGMTVGASIGIDYLTDPEENTSHVLHYFSPEVAFALAKHPDNELVIRLHHRSGVFGLFGGTREGSNVLTLGFRRRF